MRFADKHRPQSLTEVAGQFPVQVLKAFAEAPYPACFLLEGPPGVGKTSSAYALGNDINAEDFTVIASDLGIDRAREIFANLHYRPMEGRKWKLLVIEELENLHPTVQNYLKVKLEELPSFAIVIATSNGAGKLTPSLLQRFTVLKYDGSRVFAAACRDRLLTVWKVHFGDVPPPHGWTEFGWDGDSYSMRRALDMLQAHGLANRRALAVA